MGAVAPQALHFARSKLEQRLVTDGTPRQHVGHLQELSCASSGAVFTSCGLNVSPELWHSKSDCSLANETDEAHGLAKLLNDISALE